MVNSKKFFNITVKQKWIICFFALLVIAILILNSCDNSLSFPFVFKINPDGETCTLVTYLGLGRNDVVIPDEYNGYTVTNIADNAFSLKAITSITLPSTIETIGKDAFARSLFLKAVYGLENCTSLKEIRDGTFYSCVSLENIMLPNNLIKIGEKAFLGCSKLKSVKFSESIQVISKGAFSGCRALSAVDLPDSLKYIGGAAFFNCHSLKEITLPYKLSKELEIAFADCDILENIYVSENSWNFSSVNGVLFDKNIDILWTYPSGKNTTVYSIPNSVETISFFAFAFNTYLTEINIPNSVTMIDMSAFEASPNISIINYFGTIEEWQSIEKNPDWDKNSANFTVYCTNGQISKDGTVTYN